MIQIKYSSDLSPDLDIIPGLMNIENHVYTPEYRGEYHSIKARYDKNQDTFVLAFDNDNIVGYLCYLPVTERLYDELICTDTFHDDDILPEDIVSLSNGTNLYLLSIAILPEYQDTDVIIKMSDAFWNYLKMKVKDGQLVNNIVASAVTLDGENYLKNQGFKEIKRVGNQYVLYRLNYLEATTYTPAK